LRLPTRAQWDATTRISITMEYRTMTNLIYETAREEASFILDTLAGRLPLAPFNDDWACFSTYCRMQAADARRNGHADVADIMQAAGNRATRNAR
jgi:hypothetical protein